LDHDYWESSKTELQVRDRQHLIDNFIDLLANIPVGKILKAGGSMIKNGGRYLIKDGKTFSFIGSQIKSSAMTRTGTGIQKSGSGMKSVGSGIKKSAPVIDPAKDVSKAGISAAGSSDVHHHFQHLKVESHHEQPWWSKKILIGPGQGM
jgi:hypothetical protein